MTEFDRLNVQREVAPSAISRLAHTVLGKFGGSEASQHSPSNELVLYQGEVEVVTAEFVGDRVAERPRTARLPERFVERNTLAQMKIGKSAYTTPWAMAITIDGFCYLNGSYTFEREPGGTVQMMVSRTKDGHVVYVPRGYHYQPSRTIPWVGAAAEDLLPVHEVKEGHTSYR